MEKKNVYWSDAKQDDKTTWSVEKFENGKVVGKNVFKSKQDVTTFLKTINVYIDGQLAYSGV